MIDERRFIAPAFLLLAALCLGAPSVRAQQPSPPAENSEQPKGKRLSGADAWKTLLGNSATGKTSDGMRTDYYGADGTIKTQIGDDLQTGKWRLDNNRVCIEYAQDENEDDEDDGETCYRVSVTGTVAVFVDDDGEGFRLAHRAGQSQEPVTPRAIPAGAIARHCWYNPCLHDLSLPNGSSR